MTMGNKNSLILILAVLVCLPPLSMSATAGNFLSDLFGRPSSNGESFASIPLGYAPSTQDQTPDTPIFRKRAAPAAAFCVRSCDGKYFPAAMSEASNRAEGCQKLCPASETKVFSGSSIEEAISRDGKAYSETANAFRYRKELVANCTCNGKTPGGLASIKLEDDVTLRKGDLIANENGMRVATRDFQRKGAPVQLSQYSRPIKILASR